MARPGYDKPQAAARRQRSFPRISSSWLDFSGNACFNLFMRATLTPLICAGLLLLSMPVTSASPIHDAPELIYMKAGPRAHPIWISADAAASEQGDLRWQLFSSYEAGNLRSFLARNERLKSRPANAQEQGASDNQGADSECPIVLATSDQDRMDPKPNDSLSHLAEQAIAIYSGRIESVSQGFFDGVPSSLLRVRIMEAFRSSPLIDERELLIPHPYARFKIGDKSFCGGSSAIYRPAVEDRVLVFVYDPPLNATRNLIFPRSPEIFFQGSEGRLVSAESLKTDKYVAVAESVADLEELLRGGSLGKEPERERKLPNGAGNVP